MSRSWTSPDPAGRWRSSAPRRRVHRRRWVGALVFAVLLYGCGDPVEPAPVSREDEEFATGSGIDARTLTSAQLENLVLLGEVWGFAKYHHPRVVAGELNWDFELFRVLPRVLAAGDGAAAAREISGWLAGIGSPGSCSACAGPPVAVQLAPDLDWIRDTGRLGEDLSAQLQLIHRNRPTRGTQHYVTLAPGVENPGFAAEDQYGRLGAPDAGYRLLALFRYWNIIRYWFPYRDVMEEDWPGVLREFIPRMLGGIDLDGYRLEMLRLAARIHDTHAVVPGAMHLQPPAGSAQLPVVLRFVEGRAVVTGYSHAVLGPATGLAIGDVIERIDGVPVESIVDEVRPYYPASNEPVRLRDIAHRLTRGSGAATVSGTGAGGGFQTTIQRVPTSQLDLSAGRTHDLPGPAFQMLSPEVAYLKLSSARVDSVTSYVRRAEGTDVFVIDIRNYPGEPILYALGGHLVDNAFAFARFTKGDLVNPGAFRFANTAVHQPRSPHYQGRVVVLVDEVSQSQAEFTAMAFRVAPGAIVVGSTTSGADGNVSFVPLPGGIQSIFSGIGVFYPDGRPTQRVGIIPDLLVRPTIAGIRAGRDEVLEAGVTRALGRPFRLERPAAARFQQPALTAP